MRSGSRIPGVDLLERKQSLDLLRECPPGQLVIVSGEAGVGKTALVRAYCGESGDQVVWGHCDALRTPRPMGPLHDVARLVGGRFAGIMAADSTRTLMFHAFLDLLTEHRCVAVIEDAHWADEATIDALQFAGRRISGTSSRLIVTYRDEELDLGHPLRAMLGNLATDHAVQRIRLAPLSVEAVARLAAGSGLDPRELHTRTGGNPFFVSEVLADPNRRVPATVSDAVLARVAALADGERDALESVAIFPGHAPLPLVGAAPESIDCCVRSGMLTRDGFKLRFRHELARLAIDEQIPPARRAMLHAKALADLVGRGAEPAQLAYHAEEAGDVAAVRTYAVMAGERAAKAGSHLQAVDHYARALSYSEPDSPQRRAELYERYAEELARVQRDEAGIAAADRALACWREAGDQDREAAVLGRRSLYLWSAGRRADAHANVEEALRFAEKLPPGRGPATVYTCSSCVLMVGHHDREAIRIGNKAIALAEELGEDSLLARALNAVGSAMLLTDPDSAEELLVRGLRVAHKIADEAMVGLALGNMGFGLAEIRRYASAQRWLDEAIDWCSANDMSAAHRYAQATLARCLFDRGQWDQAAQILDTSTAPSRRLFGRIIALTVLGRLQTRRGDPNAAESLAEAWALASRTGELQHLWPVSVGRAELASQSGEPAEALVQDAFQLAVERNHPWAIGELGQWFETKPQELQRLAAWPYRLSSVDKARAWEKIGCPYEAAMAYAESPDHLREALIRFERLGARPAADSVAAKMRDLGQRPPRRSTMVHHYGLTAREADVLEQIRLGLRNAEIAQRLHISEKTVDHHVSAILTKLGVRTRHEAAQKTSSHQV
jgi:ATP/maltotriose-dependent transcriptional regulator MalT